MHSQNKMAEKSNPRKEPVHPLHHLQREDMRAQAKEQEASGKESGKELAASGKGQEASSKKLEPSGRRKTNSPRPADPSRHGFPSGFSLPKKKSTPLGQQGVSSPKRVVTTPADTPEQDFPSTPAPTPAPTPAVSSERDVSTPASTPDQDD